MNGDTRIERQLPQILADLGAGSSPDYAETILARTAAARQRPGWAFPERWLPMSAITQRMAAAPRISWRVVAVLALLVLALATTALYFGSQQRRLPQPFGPAGNGVIPFVSAGDLYVGDPVTGGSRLLVGGPETTPYSNSAGRDEGRLHSGSRHDLDKPINIYVVGDDGSGRRGHARSDLGLEVDLLDAGRTATSPPSQSTPAPTSWICSTPPAPDLEDDRHGRG